MGSARLPFFVAMFCLAGCAADFDAIPQRCASSPDPAACRQAAYDAFYTAERARLHRLPP
jgi:hypothetical protein